MSLPSDDVLNGMSKQDLVELVKKRLTKWKTLGLKEQKKKMKVEAELNDIFQKNMKLEEINLWYTYEEMIRIEYDTQQDIMKEQHKSLNKKC